MDRKGQGFDMTLLSLKEKFDRDLGRVSAAIAQHFNLNLSKPKNAHILIVFPVDGNPDPDYGEFLYAYHFIHRPESIKKLREIADKLEAKS